MLSSFRNHITVNMSDTEVAAEGTPGIAHMKICAFLWLTQYVFYPEENMRRVNMRQLGRPFFSSFLKSAPLSVLIYMRGTSYYVHVT